MALSRHEPCAGKLARTVLKGLGGGNTAWLPGRWLFNKKIGAKARLHHAATWDDAVAEYKGRLKAVKNGKDPRNEMAIFRSFYKQLLESSK